MKKMDVDKIKGSWNSVLRTCKAWLSIGRKIFDPSIYDNYAIRCACRKGNIECVRMLLKDKRVDPLSEMNYPLKMSVILGNIDIVKILLDDHRLLNGLENVHIESTLANVNGYPAISDYLKWWDVYRKYKKFLLF